MGAPEMDRYYRAMTSDMGSKLSGYFHGLQYRYGDPATYAAERDEMLRREARVAHSKARTTEELLKDAYAAKTEKNRSNHSQRMSKRRGGRTVTLPPESQPDRRQTQPPLQQETPPAPQGHPSHS